MAEETQKAATMGEVKRIIRKKLRRQPEHGHQELNIYPLMDVMTILLVFMIMQFAQESAQVVQTEELQIPWSTAETEPVEATRIIISRSDIVVEDHPVLTLRNGMVDPSQKQGGGTGFLIMPLNAILTQYRERARIIEQRSGGTRPFTGEVQIIADRRTPFRTLSEVIYTLGQSEFSRIRFVVLQQGGD
ncbi:MAG: ExbD/TolR family protein [Sandaracinaceae bacterium]